MFDPFAPRHEPARSIYEAFQAEAAHRPSRNLNDWIAAERQAVYLTSVRLAANMNLAAPTLEQVRSAETYALGSIDYGAKWAYALCKVMRPVEAPSVSHP